MHTFKTMSEAQDFVRNRIDVHIPLQQESLGSGIDFSASSLELDEDRFTNVYDVSYLPGRVTPKIHVHDKVASVYDFARYNNQYKVTTGGGFFFLTDQASGPPRQLSLNLALTNNNLQSLPVVDREALISNGYGLYATPLQALGVLCINNKDLSWTGSLTNHEADVKVFGNGNLAITHEQNDHTGAVRILDERSRYTPIISDEDTIDVGFIAVGDGRFSGKQTSRKGNLDIFAHDIVVRCPERYWSAEMEMRVRTVGSLVLDGSTQGAISVGPMLDTKNFREHQINSDLSLGGMPPFTERPMARMAAFQSEDGRVHMRLFDGRPGSATFPGITPSQAVESILAEGATAWGCFLDPGQTAKICLRRGGRIASRGNTHYMKWPSNPCEPFAWVPKIGRPTASALTL